MMKFITLVAISAFLLFNLSVNVVAVSLPTLRAQAQDVREMRRDIKEEIKEKISSRAAVVKTWLGGRIVIGSGKLTAVSGTTLTVEKDGKVYQVKTGTFDKCTTQFKRRFWGNSNLGEFKVGDKLNVMGWWEDEAKTTIRACFIRNTSIQKRFGVFVGKVISITSTGWTMSTVSAKRPDQTVVVSGSTKFTNRKNESILPGDVGVGHRVRVNGLWNNLNNTLTEVAKVKDFSLPVKASVTSTITPTITP